MYGDDPAKEPNFSEVQACLFIQESNGILGIQKHSSKFFAKKKELAFREFCSSLNINTPTSTVWRYIRAFTSRNSINPPRSHISEDSFLEAPSLISWLPLLPIFPLLKSRVSFHLCLTSVLTSIKNFFSLNSPN